MAPAAGRLELEHDYRPIRDYALIGDCHGAALVSCEGSIDWCCLGRFDADPVFCRILDARSGGYFSIHPVEEFSITRRYLPGTNVLETTFKTESGTVRLTDFMPVGRTPGSSTHNYIDLVAPNWVVRVVEAQHGSVELSVRYRPSIAFGRKDVELSAGANRIDVERGPILYHEVTGFSAIGNLAEARVRIDSGQRLVFVVAEKPMPLSDARSSVEKYKNVTAAFWREWIAYCRYTGPFQDAVRRSLLAIKLLIYAPTGAIVAAPTTSLPEEIGGVRNWDYRYCWLRDAAFALYALAVTGYGGEARRFSAFLPRVCAATAPDLGVVFGVNGETDLKERLLSHLEGYLGSKPVRRGNCAHAQLQIDVYGEVLDWALLYETLGGSLNKNSRTMLATLADFVADHWREPDQGLWEMRGPPRHHVHGKIMSWVALDRALKLLQRNPRWEREREAIVAEVSARTDCRLAQTYDRKDMDAALLLTATSAFPIASQILENTVRAVESELRFGDFVYRYRTDDGVRGQAGAFLICSFWLVDALLHLGRRKEAGEIFDRLIESANDVGLYSEAIDPKNRAFLGNFPQTYTHLALVCSAMHLDLYDRQGREALKGSHADRAKRIVSATLGWRALWAAFKATRRVGRFFSSNQSILRLEE